MNRRNIIKTLLGAGTLSCLGVAWADTPQSSEDHFSTFFKIVNGFPMNQAQKDAYAGYRRNYYTWIGERKTGMSLLMITLAHWEALNGRRILIVSQNDRISRYNKELLADQLKNHFFDTTKYIEMVKNDQLPGGRKAGIISYIVLDRNYYNGIAPDVIFVSWDGCLENDNLIKFRQAAYPIISSKKGRYFEIGTAE